MLHERVVRAHDGCDCPAAAPGEGVVAGAWRAERVASHVRIRTCLGDLTRRQRRERPAQAMS